MWSGGEVLALESPSLRYLQTVSALTPHRFAREPFGSGDQGDFRADDRCGASIQMDGSQQSFATNRAAWTSESSCVRTHELHTNRLYCQRRDAWPLHEAVQREQHDRLNYSHHRLSRMRRWR